MIYLIDPMFETKNKCDVYCGFVVKPLYGVIVCPPVMCRTLDP